MSTKTKSRLGRGLSSLISISGSDQLDPAPANPAPPPRSTSPTSRIDHRPTPVRELALPTHVPPADVQCHTSKDAPPADTTPHSAIIEVRVQDIVPNPHQPRRKINEASIADLAASLRSTGLIQPVVVRKVGDSLQLIAGERRWRAAQAAGLATIPAIVRETSSFEQAQMALIENIQREDLNPIDRAQAYRSLMVQLGLTQAELAGRVGEDRSSIANYLRLLELAEPVQKMVMDDELSMGHAKILAGISSHDEQARLAKLVLAQSLSVRNLERQLQQGIDVPVTKTKPEISPHLQDLERSLSQQLGLHVQVKSAAKKGRGRLILHYSTLDQFDELMNKLGVRVDA